MENNVVNLRQKEDNNDHKVVKKTSNVLGNEAYNFLAIFIDKVIEIAILFIIFFTPFFLLSFSNITYEASKTFVFFFVSGFILFIWTLNGLFIKKRFVIAKSLLTFSLFLFTIIVALSAFLGVDRASSLLGAFGNPTGSFIVYWSMFSFYFVSASLIAEKGSRAMINNLFKTFLISSLLIVLFVIGFYLDFKLLSSFQEIIFSANLITDPKGLSVYLLVVFFVSLYGYKVFIGRDTVFKIISILLAILVPLCFVFIGWDLIWFVLSGFLLLSFVLDFILGGKKEKRSPHLLARILLLVSLVFMISGVDFSNLGSGNLIWKSSSVAPAINRFLNVRDTQNEVLLDGFSGKVANSVAYQSLQAFPAIGSGAGTYYYDFAKYKPLDFNYERNWNVRFASANNEVLEKISTLGFLGMATFILLVFIAFSFLWRNARLANENKFLLLAFLSVLILQFFYVDTIVSKFVFVLLLVFAFAKNLDILEGMRFESNGHKREYNGKNYVFCFSDEGRNENLYVCALVLMFVGALSSYFAVQIFRADVLYAKIIQETEVGKINIDELDKVANITPYKGWYGIALSKIYMVRLNNLLITNTDSQEDLEKIRFESDKALSYARRAIEISPNSVFFWENYSFVYERMYELGMEGADIWAIKGFERTIELDPNNPAIRLELGKVYSLQADKLTDTEKGSKLADAEEAFNNALALKMDYPEAMIEIALVNIKRDNKGEALRKIDEASSQNNINISTAIQIAQIYYNLEQEEKATEILNVVVNLNPNISDAHYMLGLIYKEQERYQEAISEFQTVLDLNPGNTDVISKIEELEGNLEL